MTHVPKTHVLGLLGFVTASLAFNDFISNPACFEEIKCQESIMATIHRSIKHLLDNIIDDIMQEVIPGEAEKEALQMG